MTRIGLAMAAAAVLSAAVAAADPAEETPAAANPEYARGKQAIEAKDWPAAVRVLSALAVQDDRNPDVHNLLGYAYRNAGRLDEAFAHYREALRLNPRHRGAHEYIGEAFLLIDDLAQAERHLAALREICVLGCEEQEDLARAIDAYRAAHPR